MDVIPLRAHDATGEFLNEVAQGEVIYAR